MLLQVRDVEKSFPTGDSPLPVLRGVSLDLAAGQSLALTGESGSGKSTLLYLIGGLDTPDAGQIAVDGADVAAMGDRARAQLRRGTVGLVFQQFNLVPSLSVGDNLAFHARLAGRHNPGLVTDLADRLGLSGLMTRYPEDLSGGQQQRVAIGRTLAARPRLVLADEPTGNLDEATGDTVMDLLLELTADTGLLMVTHSQRLAARLDAQVNLRLGQVS